MVRLIKRATSGIDRIRGCAGLFGLSAHGVHLLISTSWPSTPSSFVAVSRRVLPEKVMANVHYRCGFHVFGSSCFGEHWVYYLSRLFWPRRSCNSIKEAKHSWLHSLSLCCVIALQDVAPVPSLRYCKPQGWVIGNDDGLIPMPARE